MSAAHQVNVDVLSPVQVIQGKVKDGELADNHSTTISKGNSNHKIKIIQTIPKICKK